MREVSSSPEQTDEVEHVIFEASQDNLVFKWRECNANNRLTVGRHGSEGVVVSMTWTQSVALAEFIDYCSRITNR